MAALLGRVAIESGVIGVGDKTVQPTGGVDPDNWIEHIKSGNAACCDTGGDGMFGVIIRTTEDHFELLSEEGDNISSLSAPILINVPSGDLIIADMVVLDVPDKAAASMSYKVEPGVYECMIHMCENENTEFFGFVIVLKKSDLSDARNDNYSDVEQLG